MELSKNVLRFLIFRHNLSKTLDYSVFEQISVEVIIQGDHSGGLGVGSFLVQSFCKGVPGVCPKRYLLLDGVQIQINGRLRREGYECLRNWRSQILR